MKISLIGFLFFLSSHLALSQSSSVSGGLISPAGKSVTGMVALVDIASPIVRRVPTGAGGEFRFEAVPPGRYLLCAQPAVLSRNAERPFLDSCAWRGSAATVDVGPKASLTKQLTIPYGRWLRVTVNDPTELLQQKDAEGPLALFVGVTDTDALQRPAWVVSSHKTARNLEMVVPASSPVQVTARSSRFRLTNDLTRQSASELTDLLPAGDEARSVTFSLSGR